MKNVISETGLDLQDATLALNVLAPELAGRWSGVYQDFERIRAVAGQMYTSLQNLGSASPLQAIQMAYNVLDTAWKWIYGQAGKKSFENLERRAKTRGEFVKRYFGLPMLGDQSQRRAVWSQALTSSKNPSPAKLAMELGVKQSPGEHLSQWDPYYVFHVSRVARRQTINPTWSTPPYDTPANQPSLWEGGVSYDEPTLLGGFVPPLPLLAKALGDDPVFLDRPPGVGAIPGKYADDYWGNAPNGGALDADPPRGDMGLDWSPLDRAIMVRGYAPPPGFTWLFSWGTYPYLSWNGTAEGFNDPRVDLCAEAAVIAAAIHGFTPLHAAIDAREVETAYKHFLAACRLRSIPVAPKSQVGPGVWLDRETLLPFSNGPAVPIDVGGTLATIEVLTSIELSFRSFFRIRRAALYQFEFTDAAFKAAALGSKDPTLREVAAGAPPPDYEAWDARDALGDGWLAEAGVGQQAEVKPPPKLKPGVGVGGISSGETLGSGSGGDDSSGAILGALMGAGALVGGGLLARHMMARKGRRR